jgi:hypothetical protein
MRERRLDTVGLRLWGRPLDDAQFSRAISALGALLAASKARDATAFQRWVKGVDIAAELTGALAARPDGRRRIAWTISPVVDAKGKVDDIQQLGLDPAALADAWAAALAPLPGWDPRGAPSFEVRAADFDLASHAQIGEWLGPRGALTASFVADPELGAGYPFEWPIRVAVVPGTGSEGLLDRLRMFAQTQHGWMLDLVDFVTPETPLEGCSILLAPWSLQAAVEWLAIGPQRFDAASLIALDGLEFTSDLSVGDVRRELIESANPSVVGVVEVPADERDRWFVDLIRELSHDHTLDHALRLATASGAVPLVIANPREITRMSVREAAVIAVNSLERFEGDLVELPSMPAGSFPMGPGRYPRTEVIRLFQDPQAFGQESRGATAVSILSQIQWDFEGGGQGTTEPEPPDGYETGGNGGEEPAMAAPDLEEADGHGAREPEPEAEPPGRAVTAKPPLPGKPPEPPARYLQAQIRSERDGASTLARGPLEPLTTYQLDVHVGPPRRGWKRGEVPLPPDSVPQDKKPHELQVIFDPGGRAKPMVSKIVLPQDGPSTTCRFAFKTPGRGKFRGRVIIQFRNRVLQTALITADLASAAAPPGPLAGLQVRIETTLRPGMVALDDRLAYDLAIVHNDDDEGRSRATASAGAWAATLRTVDIKDEVKVLQGLLSKAGQRPEDYQTLRSPATVDLIFALAMHGVDMRRGLFSESLHAPAAKDGAIPRIQILAASPNAFLPVEFLYDFPPPTQDATMCPNAEQALLDGHCDPKKFHGVAAADGAIPVVCPIGFWAMNRVIERHAKAAGLPKLKGAAAGLRSIPVPGRDTLGGLSTALFANSDRVLAPDADAVMQALAKAASQGSTHATTWTEWVEDIKARGPDILVLLAHTAKNARANQTALEIAKEDQVPAGRFSESYVRLAARASGEPDDRPGPLVFLLGCETVLPWLEYQTFVVRFQEREASIVVGTVATVAASHAANVAVKLVEELAARTGPGAGKHRAEAFGDVLLTARRRLLSQGEVMALCLTSYGDADWKLA